MIEEPAVTLELLAERLGQVENQQVRQATWTLVGILGVLTGTLVLFGLTALHVAQAQQHTAVLLRVCSVGAGRMPEGRVAWCERNIFGFRLARSSAAGDATADDSMREWAKAEGWVPPTTTTTYPEPPP
jgi:hypothetical protein